ncbi:MAG: hypothetical protein LBQ98_08305 [Nitrososphaerota archaeon]|jgi:succinate dehydrogenase/fumarate reductase flavoprotein subunit|nr:hypothetical protein [Nitrososphaerota archaeon]
MNMRVEIKNIMDENVGVVRKIANLESAKEKLYNFFLKLDVIDFGNDIAKMQLYNMAQLSIIIIEDEINRKRNIEAHYM